MLAEMLKICRGLLISHCWTSYKVNINSSELPVLKHCYRIEPVTCQIVHYLHSRCLIVIVLLFRACHIFGSKKLGRLLTVTSDVCESDVCCDCFLNYVLVIVLIYFCVEANLHVFGMFH